MNRPELIEKYGYDTKYAAHALRLGYQGCELLLNRRITFPAVGWVRLREVREGKHPLAEVVDEIRRVEKVLERVTMRERAEPDFADIQKVMMGIYETCNAGLGTDAA